MRHPLAQMPITSPTRTLNTYDKALHGPWLVVARLGWGAIALINLLIFVFSIPAYAAQLHIICTTNCEPERVTLGNAVALTHLGISLDVYIAYNFAITLFVSLLFMIVGAILFWRKSQELIGLLVSLLLITFGCYGSTLELVSALSAAHPGWIAVQLISQGAYIIILQWACFFVSFLRDALYLAGPGYLLAFGSSRSSLSMLPQIRRSFSEIGHLCSLQLYSCSPGGMV